MSDSEDENVFESADEGEETKAPQKSTAKKKTTTMTKHDKAKTTEKSADSKINKASPEKEPAKKETPRNKKQSPNKKGSPKKSPRETKTSKHSESTEKKSTDSGVSKDTSESTDSGKRDRDTNDGLEESSHVESSKTTTVQPASVKTETVSHGDDLTRTETSASDQGGAFQWGSVFNRLNDAAEKTQKSSWGSWGSSFLSAATNSVQTFTSQVGEGLNTVLETVEDSLGAIDPVELAKIEAEKASQKDIRYEDEVQNSVSGDGAPEQTMDRADAANGQHPPAADAAVAREKQNAASSDGWMSAWKISDIINDFQGATKTIVHESLDISKGLMSGTVDAGKNLVSGGLDVLESIGKTTFDAIAEGDNGLKQSLKKNKINLSQVLREAKEDSEKRTKDADDDAEEEVNYSICFDQYQGLVHVEALEMLSNQSETKIHMLLSSLSPEGVTLARQQNNSIREAFDIEFDSADEDEDEPRDHDFVEEVNKLLKALNIGATTERLTQVYTKNRDFLATFEDEDDTSDAKEIHQQAIRSLAELTAKSTETFHKTGELILSRKYEGTYDSMAASLASLTKVLCLELGILSTRYTKCFNKAAEHSDGSSSINSFITNVYLEASNSSTYIQDSFALLLPVIQHASVDAFVRK